MSDSPDPEIPDFATLAADPEIAPLLHFEPVVRKVKRKDGWTPELQRELIARIAATGSLQDAAGQMEKHASGAETLYKVGSAITFRQSWDAAIAIGRRRNGLDSPPFMGEVPGITRRTSRAQPVRGTGEHEAPLDIQPIPVVCSQCAAEGVAGDEAFADIPYLLAFEPVPRPAHDRLWDAPTQRAFVAALAVTGSVERAARSIKRHAFAVEKLRKSRGAREFNEACEAALDVARQRELANLDLRAPHSPSPLAGEDTAFGSSGGRAAALYGEGDSDERAQYEAARERIQMRLTNCRRLYLWEIAEDEAKRAAWELLCGPTDWEKAKRPIRGYAATDGAGAFETGTPNMRNPDMILPVENGWLTDLGGPEKDGRDKMAELRAEVEAEEAEQKAKEERPVPRIINMNDPDAYQRLCPTEDRPWIPAGSLPREPRWPRRESPVQVSGDSEEEAQQAFKEWQDHVDAGRIGKKAGS